jgi:hypothetical protein
LDSERQATFLRDVLNSLRLAREGVVVFDLDGTLLDNRPRTYAILERVATQWQGGDPEIARVLRKARPCELGYRVEDSLRSLGLVDAVLIEQAVRLWRQQFFSNRWLDRDVPVPGSAAFAQACYHGGAQVVYLTARDEPNMADGTLRSLREHGFPIGVPRVALRMKPDPSLSDDDHKRLECARLGESSRVVAAFDNEPAYCNLFAGCFPSASVARIDTPHRPQVPCLAPSVTTLRDFRL